MNRVTRGLALLGLLAAPAFAATTDEPRTDETKTHDEAKGQERMASRLAKEFATTEDEVKGLREQGLGWGEVRHALEISRRSGQPVSEVMKLRNNGMGWGQIARHYGFKLGDVAGRGRDDRRDADAHRGDRDDGHGRGVEHRAWGRAGRGGPGR